MNSIQLTAPAKVNLFLRILNKRKDSYHNIITLFEKISLFDEIKISKIPKGIEISSDKPITKKPSDNLMYRAAEAIFKKAGIKKGVKIEIAKRIPIAAGLGGGSSDAASALVGINRLYRLGFDKADLMGIGEKLGADVPFFISGSAFAVGKSKGEDLSQVNFKIKLWHLIIYPGFKVPTKGVYEAFDKGDFALTRKIAGDKIHPPLEYSMDFEAFESMLYNDLERAVVSKKDAIRRVIERLATSLRKKAIVSGSGPSVFCLYPNRKEAIKARDSIISGMSASESKAWQFFVASTSC